MLEEGIITSVKYEQGIPVCDVEHLHRIDEETKNVPVIRQHHGMYLVPEEEQKVLMMKLENQRFIVGVLGKSGHNPTLDAGEVSFDFDAGTSITFSKDGSGSYDVSIKASGDMNITASGNVYIDGIDFDQHTHNYKWTDSAGSGVTDPPQ